MKILRNIKKAGGGGVLSTPAGSFRDLFSSKKEVKSFAGAFTLAEMMVVLLIMSIILAAMAPVMTTRNKSDYSSPWRYSTNGSDAYFGQGESQTALIGLMNRSETTDDPARLIISTTPSRPIHISFKRYNTVLGRLQMNDNKDLILGSADLSSSTGHLNTSFGMDSLTSNTTGADNTAIGAQTLIANTTGADNTAIGQGSLMNNTTGEGNNALGTSTLRNNTTGSQNTAVGQDALYNSNANNNTAIGWNALRANTSSESNTAVGSQALKALTGGTTNTAVGAMSLASSTTGENNVAMGYQSLNASTTGNHNTAIGSYSQLNGTTGNYNTSLGYDSLRDNDSGSYNTAVGYRSNFDDVERHTITGTVAVGAGSRSWYNYAIAIGYDTLANKSSGIALGNSAHAEAPYGMALGYNAKSSGEGSGTAVGGNAEASNFFTTAVGRSAIANSYRATALGANANALGSYTTSIGYDAQATVANTTALGAYSTANGQSAVSLGTNAQATGLGSVAIGGGDEIYYAANATNAYSIAIGNDTLASNNHSMAVGYYAESTGSDSLALGYNAKAKNTNNIAIGANACSNVTGSNKICIGANSGPSSGTFATDSQERIFIGGTPHMKNRPGYGGGTAPLEIHNDSSRGTSVVVNGTLLVRGHIAFSSPLIADPRLSIISNKKAGADDTFNVGGWLNASDPYNNNGNPGYLSNSWISDRRLKYVGKESQSGLDEIRELKVFNYTFKKDKSKTPHVGVIAQDLQKVFPDAVKKGVDGFLQIRFEDMFFAMINAIKELDAKYQAQEKRINELEKRIEALEAKIK